MPTDIIRLRYAGTCSICGAALPASTKAHWDKAAKTVTCLACGTPTADGKDPADMAVELPSVPPERVKPKSGRADASAQKEFARRHQKREEVLDHLAIAATGNESLRRRTGGVRTSSSIVLECTGEVRVPDELQQLVVLSTLLHGLVYPEPRVSIATVERLKFDGTQQCGDGGVLAPGNGLVNLLAGPLADGPSSGEQRRLAICLTDQAVQPRREFALMCGHLNEGRTSRLGNSSCVAWLPLHSSAHELGNLTPASGNSRVVTRSRKRWTSMHS